MRPRLITRGLDPDGACSTRSGAAAACLLATSLGILQAQNVVDPGPVGPIRPTTTISVDDVQRLLDLPIDPPAALPASALPTLAQVLAETRWRPFHSTLGISGFETYFTHADEFCFVLGRLPPDHAIRRRLEREIADFPPYGPGGYPSDSGTPREWYEVPDSLRSRREEPAGDLFGVYSYWQFCHRYDFGRTPEEMAERSRHWQAVRGRVQSIVDAGPPSFDPARTDYSRDESEHLNGNIAGLIGAIRLARLVNDPAFESSALPTLRQSVEWRVNLERINPRVWTPTHFASKSLHTGKLARYLKLTPELGFALREWTDGAAQERIAALRRLFPTWWMTRADRLIGGENLASPLHFSRAIWQATAWIDADAAQLRRLPVDVPWCRADLGFLEKCSLSRQP